MSASKDNMLDQCHGDHWGDIVTKYGGDPAFAAFLRDNGFGYDDDTGAPASQEALHMLEAWNAGRSSLSMFVPGVELASRELASQIQSDRECGAESVTEKTIFDCVMAATIYEQYPPDSELPNLLDARGTGSGRQSSDGF